MTFLILRKHQKEGTYLTKGSLQVPLTGQFSNLFYQNLGEIYHLKEILFKEGLYHNMPLTPINPNLRRNNQYLNGIKL